MNPMQNPNTHSMSDAQSQSELDSHLKQLRLPLIAPGQRARVSESWIDNLHRGKNGTTNQTNSTNGERIKNG